MDSSAIRRRGTVSLATKVRLLSDPRTWPECPRMVTALETHMSWVFLTVEHAWKLKKPVHYGELDFRRLSARQHFCGEEVRLNRRLAPSVYLDAVPLVVDAHGALRPGGDGRVVDWLVKMRRLPASAMLDALLDSARVTRRDVRRIVRHLVAFYRTQPAAPMSGAAYRRRLREGIDANESELRHPGCSPSTEAIAALCATQRALLVRRRDLFDRRIDAGRVVEGHGDLRPEHVYLGLPFAIIDCLEFSKDLRTLDIADELGFLALEGERVGVPELGAALFAAYGEATGDTPPPVLVHFYQSYRAAIRAKLALWHLREPAYRDSAHWRAKAQCYLELAQRHIEHCASALTPDAVSAEAVR
ncbi:hypothetical protein GWC77_06260 [Paraburkholderia sp. NMBU_R16]|uniref:hypothetical protein n=1 Tax=Paraburkholderia sp. NMBU_R16 TaxID=2698676 RepID=UPI00156387AF|nr:hypothetical protein [Paraburkholderia sp. NMBU_R16]NRO95540.1 hypothetical protein [Paraburkholderia sp. NMBU_R16]